MIDNEIIKKVEHWKGIAEETNPDIFPIKNDSFLKMCDLIIRQQSEIERLQKNEQIATAIIEESSAEFEKYRHIEQTVKDFWSELKKLSAFKDLQEPTLTELLEYIEYSNAEATKEFAKKVDYLICTTPSVPNRAYRKLSTDIKNLLKGSENKKL